MSCEALELSYRLFVFLMSVMAIVILVVLSFTTRRKNLCLDCCGGRPGLFAPVDLLHRSPHRLAYAAIFGVMANLFLSFALLGADKHCTSGDSYGQAICSVVLSKALVVAWLCLLYGPLFACVDTPKPLLGHIMGLLYLLFLILTLELDNGYYIYSGCDGMEYDKAETAINVLSNLPSYVFYVILLVWFGYQIVNDVFIKKTGRGILFTHRKYGHLFKYTRTLLKKKEPIKQGRWQQLKSFFWVYDKDFRFPLKFLAPLVVMMSITFKLFFIVVRVSYIAVSQVDAWKSLHPDINELWYDAGLMAITGISAVATIGGIMSVLFCLLLLFQMMATVHKDLQLAAQGKFKFYSRKPPSHTDILVSSLKYGGYQIGYFVWAWLIFWIVSVVFGLVAVAVIIGLMLFPTYVGPSLFKLFLTVVWLPVVLIVHKVMCKFVFLESGSGGKFLSITNRNALNWFSYFVFFYNAIVGFFGAIIRVLLSLLFGTLLLFRLDQNVMMDGFHFADRGNKIYRGFLYLEHTYNNPVANTFVALLLDRKEGPLSFKAPIQNQRIRNRWLVAYTLLHNPSLCPLTGTQLREQQSKETQTEGNLYEESLATPLLIN